MKEQQTTAKTKRTELVWVHWLRVIAICVVVAAHGCAKGFTALPVRSLAWQTLNVWEILARWSVPAFVMISGALLLDPERALPLRKLFGKYFVRIFTVLVFWSLVYALLFSGLYQRASLAAILESARQGHPHLWYLYMLLGLYLVTPILRPLVRDRALMWYYVALAAVFAMLVPMLETFGKLPLTRAFLGRLCVNSVLGYTGYFVLGRLLATAETTRRQRLCVYVLAIAASLTAILVDGIGSAVRNELYYPLMQEITPNAALQAAALLLLLRELTRGREAPRLIRTISDLSFGVYLSHEIIIDLLRRFCGLDTLTVHPLLSVPLILLLSLTLSAALTALLKKIPVLQKLI